MNQRGGYLRKIKIDKLLSKLTKRHRKNIQVNKIKSKMGVHRY